MNTGPGPGAASPGTVGPGALGPGTVGPGVGGPGAAGLLWLWATVAELGPGDPQNPPLPPRVRS